MDSQESQDKAFLKPSMQRKLGLPFALAALLHGGAWLTALKPKERSNLAENAVVLVVRTRNAVNRTLKDFWGSQRSGYKEVLKSKLEKGEMEDPLDFYVRTETLEGLSDDVAASQARLKIETNLGELSRFGEGKKPLEVLNAIMDRKYQGKGGEISSGSTSLVRLANEGIGNCEAVAKMNDVLVSRLFPSVTREMQFMKIEGQEHMRLVVMIEGQRYAMDEIVFPLSSEEIEGTVVASSDIIQNAYVGRRTSAAHQPAKDEKHPSPLSIQKSTDSVYNLDATGIDTGNVRSQPSLTERLGRIGRNESVTMLYSGNMPGKLGQPGDPTKLEKVSEEEARQLLMDAEALSKRLKRLPFHRRSTLMRLFTAKVTNDQDFLRKSFEHLYQNRQSIAHLFGDATRLNPITVVMESTIPYSRPNLVALKPDQADHYWSDNILLYPEPGIVAYSLGRISPLGFNLSPALQRKLQEYAQSDSRMAAYIISVLSERKELNEKPLKAIACSGEFSDNIRLDAAKAIDDKEFLEQLTLPTGRERMLVLLSKDNYTLSQSIGSATSPTYPDAWAAYGPVNKKFSDRVNLILANKYIQEADKKLSGKGF